MVNARLNPWAVAPRALRGAVVDSGMARTAFPDSLPVIHGAPLLHRPRMAREDRLTLARCVTECAVGRAREADMRPLHAGPPEGHFFYGRDGVLWARVRLASPSVRPMALMPGQFADMLARAGFSRIREHRTRRPLLARLITAIRAE